MQRLAGVPMPPRWAMPATVIQGQHSQHCSSAALQIVLPHNTNQHQFVPALPFYHSTAYQNAASRRYSAQYWPARRIRSESLALLIHAARRGSTAVASLRGACWLPVRAAPPRAGQRPHVTGPWRRRFVLGRITPSALASPVIGAMASTVRGRRNVKTSRAAMQVFGGGSWRHRRQVAARPGGARHIAALPAADRAASAGASSARSSTPRSTSTPVDCPSRWNSQVAMPTLAIRRRCCRPRRS